MIYTSTSNTSPGKNVFTKSFLSFLVIGLRSVRNSTSSSVGGGVFSSNHVNTISGTQKTRPVKNGVHHSFTFQSTIRYLPTVCVSPDAKTKLAASAAPRNSVDFLPSR